MNKFKCTRCGHSKFYHEGQFVYCHKCNGMYSSPGRGELKKMEETGALEIPGFLHSYYNDMTTFKEFCRHEW